MKNILVLTIPESKGGVTGSTNYMVDSLRKQEKYYPLILKHSRTGDIESQGFSLCNSNHKEIYHSKYINPIINKLKEENKSPNIVHVHSTTYQRDKSLKIIAETFETPVVYIVHAILKYILLPRETKEKILNDKPFTLERNKYPNEKDQEELLRISDKVVLISDTHKKIMEKLYPQYEDKYATIPHFTDFASFYSKSKQKIDAKAQEIRKKINGEKIFGYCGRLEEQKGSEKLVELINGVQKEYPASKILLIGSTAEKKSEEDARNCLNKLGVNKQEHIYFTDWKGKAELASYFRAIDALIQPVFTPNLYGIATLEAASIGTPLITCEGELSLGTTISLEDTINAIKKLEDKSFMERHTTNVKKTLTKKYSEKIWLKKLTSLYDELGQERICT